MKRPRGAYSVSIRERLAERRRALKQTRAPRRIARFHDGRLWLGHACQARTPAACRWRLLLRIHVRASIRPRAAKLAAWFAARDAESASFAGPSPAEASRVRNDREIALVDGSADCLTRGQA